MADFDLGADLPVTDLGISDGNSATSKLPADPGFVRDAQGNQYEDRSQRSGQAAGTAGQQPGTPATAAIPTGKEGTTVPNPNDAVLAAVRAEAKRATDVANSLLAREQAREEQEFRTRLQTMQPNEARLAIRERQVEQAANAVQAALAQHQSQQAQAEPFMKGLAVDLLTSEYTEKTGLPAETLKGILSKQSSPQQMEAMAETLVTLSRDALLQSRAKTGTDAAATAGSGTSRPATAPTWRQQSLREQLTSVFNTK